MSRLPGPVVAGIVALRIVRVPASSTAEGGVSSRHLAASWTLGALSILLALGIALALAFAGLVPLLLRLDRQHSPVHIRLGAHLADGLNCRAKSRRPLAGSPVRGCPLSAPFPTLARPHAHARTHGPHFRPSRAFRSSFVLSWTLLSLLLLLLLQLLPLLLLGFVLTRRYIGARSRRLQVRFDLTRLDSA